MSNVAAAAAAVPVSVHGFTWTALFALILCIINGTAVGAWLKNRPAMRQLDKEADEKFRDDLLHRVERLENQLEEERARHSAERALDRHRLNNVTACFDAMLLMLKAAPEKAAEIIVHIENMRARQIEAEALEKGAIAAAVIHAAQPKEERA